MSARITQKEGPTKTDKMKLRRGTKHTNKKKKIIINM